MSQHTPGPWYSWESEGVCGVGKNHSNLADILTVVRESNRPHAEDVANMRLIAAAPDLLAAAERYLDFRHTGDIGMGHEYSGEHPQTQLKNAIARARGDQ